MNVEITKFEEALVAEARRFLTAARENPESTALLRRFGFSVEELERGERLVDSAARAMEWERDGRAWNYLSSTPERRVAEAEAWYVDTRLRYLRACFKRAEQEAGWVGNGPASKWPLSKKLGRGTLLALRRAADAASLSVWLEHRAERKRNVERAQEEKPADAPPPKDAAVVELAGWYERFRLLAQRVFRDRPDLLAPFGLVAGKPPPRLRSRSAREKYGERAASLQAFAPANHEPEDLVDQGLASDEAPERPRSLPIL